MDEVLSRRGFLKSAAGVAWLGASWPAVLAAAQQAAAAREAGRLETLSAADGADLAAIAAQIIPSGDGLPGASEAGVVYFMDAALRGFLAGAAAELGQGLAALNRKAAAVQAGTRFAALSGEQQQGVLKEEESSGFFGLVHFMTVAGMFALPSYGGNKDHAGWKMLGFEHRHFWVPPFGHYDAAVAKPGNKP